MTEAFEIFVVGVVGVFAVISVLYMCIKLLGFISEKLEVESD